MKKPGREFKQIELLRLIAYCINCDNGIFHFTDKVFTPESVWGSNSHGELFGVFNTMQIVKEYYEHLKPEYQKGLKDVLSGKRTTPAKAEMHLIGLKCIQTLYRTTDEFNKQVDEVWEKCLK